MFKKTAIVAAMSLALSATAQADYRWEIDAAAARTNIDVGREDGDVDQFAIDGSFFFAPVDTSKGPYGEAAFLDHASSLTAGYIYTDLDDFVEDLDGDQYGISVHQVFGPESFPLIIEAAWNRQTPDFSDIDTYSLGFGAYVTDTTTLVLTYRTNDVENNNDIDPGDIDAYELALEHLWHLSSGAIKVEGSYGLIDVDNGDDIDSYNIGGTWYMNNNLGFGVGFSRFDNFGTEADSYTALAEWFVNERVGFTLEYAYSEIDDTDIDSDTVLLGAQIRF